MIDDRKGANDTSHSAASQSDASRFEAATLEEQRRILELRLVKIRSEATAARLEARAAEIELLLRKLRRGEALSSLEVPDATVPDATEPDALSGEGGTVAIADVAASIPTERPPCGTFQSWDDVREALARSKSLDRDSDVSEWPSPEIQPSDSIVSRVDASHRRPPRPHLPESEQVDEVGTFLEGAASTDEDSSVNFPATVSAPELTSLFTETASSCEPLVTGEVVAVCESELNFDSELVCESELESEFDCDTNQPQRARKKSAAWVVSTITHLGILLALATIGLQTQRPRDQVSLSASAVHASEEAMNTFTIESSEPESEPTPAETEYEVSPVGEMAVADLSPSRPPSLSTPSTTTAFQESGSAAAALEKLSESETTTQFCGVEGGGNHFVYLVDSSKSMGSGFASARAELLASIEALKPDQRFYVVFFDAKPDFMRLSHPREDEPASVYATPENVSAIRRWSMRIAVDNGRAPYDPLRFALKLRPDVIFLLSDGEFPQGIEDLLREHNKVENLFGDSGPISIVHTIGYHSKEGESRMRRIAKQNSGQYRYIPKP